MEDYMNEIRIYFLGEHAFTLPCEKNQRVVGLWCTLMVLRTFCFFYELAPDTNKIIIATYHRK